MVCSTEGCFGEVLRVSNWANMGMSVLKPDIGLEERVDVIRAFNRMYAHRIGLLSESIFGSSFSAAEIRVLNELSTKKPTTASVLCKELGMDGGYLSRILSSFERKGLISKERSKEDARQRLLLLTKKGRKIADEVITEAQLIMMSIVGPLAVEEQIRLVAAMSTIDRIINGADGIQPDFRVRAPYTLRPHRLGDIGLVLHCQVVQYAADNGWNEEFEALIAGEAEKFIRNFNPEKECGCIAEIDGRFVGSVFLRDEGQGTGAICLLFVKPEARGMGMGVILLNEIVHFATQAGYKNLIMEVEGIPEFMQEKFRGIGWKKLKEERHVRFGKEQLGQLWGLDLPLA